jgi:hypothetical protein
VRATTPAIPPGPSAPSTTTITSEPSAGANTSTHPRSLRTPNATKGPRLQRIVKAGLGAELPTQEGANTHTLPKPVSTPPKTGGPHVQRIVVAVQGAEYDLPTPTSQMFEAAVAVATRYSMDTWENSKPRQATKVARENDYTILT